MPTACVRNPRREAIGWSNVIEYSMENCACIERNFSLLFWWLLLTMNKGLLIPRAWARYVGHCIDIRTLLSDFNRVYAVYVIYSRDWTFTARCAHSLALVVVRLSIQRIWYFVMLLYSVQEDWIYFDPMLLLMLHYWKKLLFFVSIRNFVRFL